MITHWLTLGLICKNKADGAPIYLGSGGYTERPIIYLNERKAEALEEVREAAQDVAASDPSPEVISALQAVASANEDAQAKAVESAIARLRAISDRAAEITRMIDALAAYQRIARMIEEEEAEEAAIFLMLA